MQRRNRIGWIEWARVLGAVGVVVLHVLTSSFMKVPEDISDVRLAGYIVVSVVFGRWAVPSFFMITGYLLLAPMKDLRWPRAWGYAKRMILVLLTFGLFFSLLEEAALCVNGGEPLSPRVFLRAAGDVLTASSWDHLWYVYALIGVYALSPFVRRLLDRLGKRRFTTMTLVLFVVVMVIPTGFRLWQGFFGPGVDVAPTGAVALLANIPIGLACFCLGGCLRYWRPRHLLPVALVATACVATMTVVALTGLFAEGYGDMGFVYLQGSCFACIYAVCVLTMLRQTAGDDPMASDAIAARLAEDSFGIYVIHPLYVHIVLLATNPLAFPPVLYEAAFVIIVLAVSDLSTRALRHVPLIRSLL